VSETLAELLQEPLESVAYRERHSLEDLLSTRRNRVVLFGSGNLGRRAAEALREIGINPLAITDNNQMRWGTQIDGLEVLAPVEAAKRYGRDSVFLVTIWNEFHWFKETEQQLKDDGCDCVASYPKLHWRFPERFLPWMLSDLPSKLYKEAGPILAAAAIWADAESKATFETNIRLRALGDLTSIPGRPVENTYLPMELIKFSDDDSFLDCGATSGEMLQDLVKKRSENFERFHAVEADNISYPKLEAYREGLPASLREKLKLYKCAVGAMRSTVRFVHSGLTGSRISDEGLPIECYPIDDLFADQPLTFIKMDIEGAEFDALKGASKVIQRDRPILAICVYHTQNDIWRIPLFIHGMLAEHKLYLRAYEGDGYQTVMYAVPADRVV
jgi:FkbM family methyltransferase